MANPAQPKRHTAAATAKAMTNILGLKKDPF
jgi:hypothetical protein